jgi:hypothetical protein
MALVLDLMRDVKRGIDLSKQALPKGQQQAVHRNLEEDCWSLAVLWKAPPAGTSAQVETWISNAGLISELQQYYNQL